MQYAGILFFIVMDWAMRSKLYNGENGLRWKFMSKRDDLHFADDIVLLLSTERYAQTKQQKPEGKATEVEFKVSTEKAEVMRIS